MINPSITRSEPKLIEIACRLGPDTWPLSTRFFSRDVGLADAFMDSATDMHERLGQAITCARINRVGTLWSEPK